MIITGILILAIFATIDRASGLSYGPVPELKRQPSVSVHLPNGKKASFPRREIEVSGDRSLVIVKDKAYFEPYLSFLSARK